MLIGNNHRINYTDFKDDSAGAGGGWDINLNSGAIGAAASLLSGATTAYNDALANLTSALKQIENAWQGDAAAAWKTKADEVKGKLDAVGLTLNNNASNLSKISQKVSEIEAQMTSNVTAITAN